MIASSGAMVSADARGFGSPSSPRTVTTGGEASAVVATTGIAASGDSSSLGRYAGVPLVHPTAPNSSATAAPHITFRMPSTVSTHPDRKSTTMSRTRAKTEPFWATAITKMQSGPAAIVRGLHGVVQRSKALAPYLWPGSGWRTGSVEHESGTAIDWIITENTGIRPTAAERAAALKFIDWLIANHQALGIEGILFSRDGKNRTEVWGYSTPGRGWRTLADRGSISGNHIDHIHIKVKAGASWPSSLNSAVIGGSSPNSGSSSAGSSSSGSSSSTSTTTLKRGSKGTRVATLQKGLNKVFPAYRTAVSVNKGKLLTVDSIFGAATEAWIKEFQRRTGLSVDGIVGAKTIAKLAGYGIKL